jgi:short-subunit dehydrogenase
MKKNNFKGKWAVVTGASKGLGFAYAEQLLQQGINVIGVARNAMPFQALAQKYPDVEVEAINLDLSDPRNCQVLFDKVQKRDIAYLINNAGFGVWGFFDETDITKEMNMIDLNIKALHILTKLFVQKFKAQNYGRIFNIGSVLAGFVSGPVFSSYYASKAYVMSLGVAINTELKKAKSHVRVVTICPGQLKTDFWASSREDKKGTKGKVANVDVFARKSLKKAMKTNRDYLIIGFANKMAKWGALHLPRKWILNSIYRFQKSR